MVGHSMSAISGMIIERVQPGSMAIWRRPPQATYALQVVLLGAEILTLAAVSKK